MNTIDVKLFSEKQRRAWQMRYQFGWRLKRIALELGISPSGASKLIRRAHARAGVAQVRVSVIRTRPTPIRIASLSRIRNV